MEKVRAYVIKDRAPRNEKEALEQLQEFSDLLDGKKQLEIRLVPDYIDEFKEWRSQRKA